MSSAKLPPLDPAFFDAAQTARAWPFEEARKLVKRLEKSAGATLDGVLLREPAAIDIALGTPPKTPARAANRDPFTRMAESAMLRQLLVKAQEYQRNKTANAALPRDLGMEALGRLLKKEIPARIQANNATDIRTALRLAQEFDFDLILDGAAGAWEFKDELARKKVAVVLGQVSHQYVSNEEIPDKQDYPKPDERLAGRLTNAGIPTAMATAMAPSHVGNVS